MSVYLWIDFHQAILVSMTSSVNLSINECGSLHLFFVIIYVFLFIVSSRNHYGRAFRLFQFSIHFLCFPFFGHFLHERTFGIVLSIWILFVFWLALNHTSRMSSFNFPLKLWISFAWHNNFEGSSHLSYFPLKRWNFVSKNFDLVYGRAYLQREDRNFFPNKAHKTRPINSSSTNNIRTNFV